MDKRIVQFVSALRANGARVSLAESADSVKAIEQVGVLERDIFKIALKASLVKEPADVAVFDRLFPHFFGSDGPNLQPPQGLSPKQMQQLMDAINELREQIREMMRKLATGEKLTRNELEQAAKQAGIPKQVRGNEQIQKWMTERMLRQMGLTPDQLRDALEALLKQLKEQGMSQEGRQEMRETVRGNAEAMREQVDRFMGQSMMRQPEDTQRRQRIDDLMDRPLSSLNQTEADELRRHVRRLVARLRSRAALRMRRAKRQNLDIKATIRYNQRYGGVPIELKQKRRVLKPKITVIVDVSTSMRPVAEFMLRLVYEMQDQVSKARSFAFIGDIHEISMIFSEHRPEDAVPIVLQQLPPGSYNTDLGGSLDTFCHQFADAVDQRTTLIFVGDGRNNFNDPRIDLVHALKLRARRIIWMNPESPYLWNTGDSDMNVYAPLCNSVHEVATLKQLADAVDDLFKV
jgi:hypothetical protein